MWVEEGSFDQLLVPNSGAFDLINVKSPICRGWGGGGGGGGLQLLKDSKKEVK